MTFDTKGKLLKNEEKNIKKVENKVKRLELGGVDCVTKPFNKHELKARIKTQINLLQALYKIK